MQFIDAQGAGEPLQDHLAVRGQIQAGQLPAQAVVDEAVGQRQQEVASQGGLGLLDVEAVVQQAVQDGLTDGGVVVGLGRHVQRPGAEVLAAAAAGAVLCVGDLQAGAAVVGQGANATPEGAFAVPQAATGGAGGATRGATDSGDQIREHGLCPSGWRRQIPLP